jgi:hypothetical protein
MKKLFRDDETLAVGQNKLKSTGGREHWDPNAFKNPHSKRRQQHVWQILVDQFCNAALWTVSPVKPIKFVDRMCKWNTLLEIGFVNERDIDTAAQ